MLILLLKMTGHAWGLQAWMDLWILNAVLVKHGQPLVTYTLLPMIREREVKRQDKIRVVARNASIPGHFPAGILHSSQTNHLVGREFSTPVLIAFPSDCDELKQRSSSSP